MDTTASLQNVILLARQLTPTATAWCVAVTHDKLHSCELVNDVAQAVLDGGPGDLVVRLGGVLHGLLGQVEEDHNVLEHAHGLVERTVAVVGSVGVLLEEVVLDELGHLQNDLVTLCQGTLRVHTHAVRKGVTTATESSARLTNWQATIFKFSVVSVTLTIFKLSGKPLKHYTRN